MKQSQDPSGRHAAEYINSMNWTEKYVAKERMIRLILKEEWMFGLDLRNVGFQLYHPHSHAHAQEETHEQDGLERTFRMKDLLAREDMRCDPSSFLTAAV
jgi:RNA-splicing ligase RtcB